MIAKLGNAYHVIKLCDKKVHVICKFVIKTYKVALFVMLFFNIAAPLLLCCFCTLGERHFIIQIESTISQQVSHDVCFSMLEKNHQECFC